MFHRLTAILIVIFWLCMTGLLVVREMYPEFTRLNDVPAGYVARLIFQHEQVSDLEIYEGPRHIGNIYVQPRHSGETGALTLEHNGWLNVELPGGIRQRLSWTGSLEMDSAFHVQRVLLKVGLQEGGGRIDLRIEPPKNIAHFSARSGSGPVEESDLTLDEAGFMGLMARAGMGSVSLAQLRSAGAQFSVPDINAQTSSLHINGEAISTFLFTVKMESQPLVTAHLSQLGQVLCGDIPVLGYRFAPRGMAQ